MAYDGNFKEPTFVLQFPGVLINYAGLVLGYRFMGFWLPEQGNMGPKRVTCPMILLCRLILLCPHNKDGCLFKLYENSIISYNLPRFHL